MHFSTGNLQMDLHRTLAIENKVGDTRTVNKLLEQCDIDECEVCSVIICPYADPLHFHHDGCPVCEYSVLKKEGEGGSLAPRSKPDNPKDFPALQAEMSTHAERVEV